MTDETTVAEFFDGHYSPDADDYNEEPPDVSDLESVDYHVRRIRDLRDQMNELEAVYRAELNRIRDRLESRQLIIQRQISWHQTPIEAWHRAHPDRKTIELPNGTLRLRTSKTPKVSIVDMEQVHRWAIENHPEILKAPGVTDVRKTVEIVEFKDGYSAVDPSTGAEVEGLDVFIPDPTWSLDTEPGEAF